MPLLWFFKGWFKSLGELSLLYLLISMLQFSFGFCSSPPTLWGFLWTAAHLLFSYVCSMSIQYVCECLCNQKAPVEPGTAPKHTMLLGPSISLYGSSVSFLWDCRNALKVKGWAPFWCDQFQKQHYLQITLHFDPFLLFFWSMSGWVNYSQHITLTVSRVRHNRLNVIMQEENFVPLNVNFATL